MPKKGESKLTEEQWAEVVRRYEAGESASQIAAYFSLAGNSVAAFLRKRGLMRSRSEAAILRRNIDARSISPDRWNELYWSPGSGYPSMGALAEQFGCSRKAVSRCLCDAGISRRSMKEQRKIDFAAGRARSPLTREIRSKAGKATAASPGRQVPPAAKTPRHRAALSASAARWYRENGHRIAVLCAWCGEAKEIELSRQRGASYHACSKSHGTLYRHHLRKKGPDAPRPVIVERLEALAEERYGMLRERQGVRREPYRLEWLEKLAPEIGAGDAEIMAVWEKEGDMRNAA